MATTCTHIDQIAVEVPDHVEGCEECLATGGWWVHLRTCMICGHVGCCDNSPNRHATKHAHATSHPIIRSAEPGEDCTGATSTRSCSSSSRNQRGVTAV